MSLKDFLSKAGGVTGNIVKNVVSESMNASNMEIGGRTLSQWDRRWKCIGKLKDANLSPYNHCVGLYRHVIDGETIYVGRAIELYNGGLRKRLSDYRRKSSSARKHNSGKVINERLDDIVTYILIVGDDEEAIENTKKLEKYFILKYKTKLNVQNNR